MPEFATVDAPVAHWARCRPDAIAIDDGRRPMNFAQLDQAVRARAAALAQSSAPAVVWVDEHADLPARVADFLGIVASGRCAAVGDPDWPGVVRRQVLASIPQDTAAPPSPGPATPFYIGFTSGSTGLPKGFRRTHRSWTESFRACLDAFGPGAATRVLAPGRCSHSLFLFGMLLGLWTGAGVLVQEQFSAARALDSLEQGAASCLMAVPSQLLVMLELAARRKRAPIHGVSQVIISGARWMRHRTVELRALFPQARIVEFYGASETSFIAWTDADPGLPAEAVGRPFAKVEIDVRGAQGPGTPGLIYVRSPMLFMDYVGGGDDGTAALRKGDWMSVRDMGYLDEQGRLCLAGRQKRMIVTQGKNLFPEEVETVLAAHPGVAAASVHGVPDELRGMQVVAVVLANDGAQLRAAELAAWCRARLEPYKAPRRYFLCQHWPLTVSSKTNHAALAAALAAATTAEAADSGEPRLRVLP
ncbi:AMP-binding protein [Candidimonas humi]|uniref:AMP-binding protein n=1 Tax=Candidimonas humi TaxID=683355 RepID=A0ABV8P4H9_9BURK|nr:AMP-binding protein [Candidimonas humi]MBV6307335.1 AMP-binding protein [Candidimonas humi]